MSVTASPQPGLQLSDNLMFRVSRPHLISRFGNTALWHSESDYERRLRRLTDNIVSPLDRVNRRGVMSANER